MSFAFASLAGSRRLPIYLVLDISDSMAGAPLEAMGQGLALLHQELLCIPQTARDAWVSVITFSSEAAQIASQTRAEHFTPPVLTAGGATALGKGLNLLTTALNREVITGHGEHQRDHKPHILLLSDGQPTDCWPRALRAFRRQWPAQSSTTIGLGCGPQANLSVLAQIADISLGLADTAPDTLARLFRWLSQSVRLASLCAAQGRPLAPQADLAPWHESHGPPSLPG